MKRIICIVLTLVMVLSTVTLLASCSKSEDGEIVVSKKTVEVDLADYTIVYSAELTNSGKQQAIELANQLKALTNVTFRPQGDDADEVMETEDLEILIGQTARKETEKALKETGALGWTVRAFDNKIVIVGTTPFLTRVALAYFVQNYVKSEAVKGSVMTLNQKVVVSDMETIALAADSVGQYHVVYSHLVDDTVNTVHYASDANPTKGGNATDYIYDLCVQTRDMLAEKSGAKASTFPYVEDTTEATGKEVMIGNMDRELMKQELAQMNVNDYAVAIRDGNILVAAWNDEMLKSAYAAIEDMFAGSVITDEAGNETLLIPANCCLKETLNNGWSVDFPKPEGADISLNGTVDVSDHSVEYVYTGDGVTMGAYTSYCDALEAAGFKTIAAETQWEGSAFRTYFNEETGVTLHVYYAAYTHAKEQEVKDSLKSIRVIASSTEYVTLPDAEMLNPNQEYTWRTSPMITQSSLDGASDGGMSYIVTLADGSFVLFDGGYKFANSAKELWQMLTELYRKTHNNADPSSGDPIHIRAWVMTHEHQDHFGTFREFVKGYGQDKALKFERLLFNTTSASQQYNCHNPESTVRDNFDTLKSQVKDGLDIIKIHTGQVFYFANMKMEVLYTHEDAYPKGLEYFNNSTSVVRTTMTALAGAEDEAVSTCIWLGDAERIVSRRLRSMYGNTALLQAEHVQVAHHGHAGVEIELYRIISPSVLWWPTRFSAYADRISNANHKVWYYRVNYELAYNVASVKTILVADTYNTTMIIKGSENDYTALFDLVGNKEIEAVFATNGGVVIHKQPTE